MQYMIAVFSVLTPLMIWSGVVGTAAPQFSGAFGDGWFAHSIETPALKEITQGRSLTFIAYESGSQANDGEPTVTQVYPVRSDILALEIETGKVILGKQVPYKPASVDLIQPADDRGDRVVLQRNRQRLGHLIGANRDILYTFDQFEGSNLDPEWADRPGSYRLTSKTDAEFRSAQQPRQVFRKSKPTNIAITAQGKRWSMRHTLYLKLPRPLKVGETYELSFKGQPLESVTFTYNPQRQRSEAVHVSQIGFRPGDSVKVGFLSTWMGNGGGLDYRDGIPFWLINDRNNKVVYEGRSRLSVAAETPEDPYRNYNLTDVYALDFHDFKGKGRYRLCVESVGCSFSFPIQNSVWQLPFETAVRGLYHQRSGIKIGPPYTNYQRPRAFNPRDGMRVYQSQAKLVDTNMGIGDQDVFDALVAGVSRQTLPDAWGGYFDAGDWDRRIQHLAVARSLLELAELFPEKMAAINLNIPESNNRLPDIVDEALWPIDLFQRLQKPGGGIPGGIESAAHPKLGEASWQESLQVMAYAPDMWSTYQYAATAAQAASVLQNLNAKKADAYQESALRAMFYAERQYSGAPKKEQLFQVSDARNLAALELWRLTGQNRWHRLFLETTAFTTEDQRLARWGKFNQTDAAFLYARLNQEGVDPIVQANARQALLQQANRIGELTTQTGFQWAKEDPRAPVGWGISLGSPGEAITLLRAHYLEQDSCYFEAALRATQFPLGANPDNLVYTTGLGKRNPQNPLIPDQRILGVKPPPGITLYGPIDLSRPSYTNYWFTKRVLKGHMFPEPAAWPTAEVYVDVHLNVAMTEFTVFQSMGPAAYVWGYLATQN